ncbi:arylformamidase [Virgibacillus sp. 179-BFC.A HS]|uniref:Kynurenine formamidase n=1 Tax=Tigheibacillus jepli TaxID=3035914 RepID=A0ABU5CIE7_9BACI|nr:arylformamidase [Virgibacillus sp. 179-BFC.A HS]MDY0406116.1 arylformamidase [Virgibacillus sp. 179-BFC.A HS]
MNQSNWIDISQPLSKAVRTWPGDAPFSFALSATKEETGSVNIGELKMSVHTGTHIDAPFHFDNNGKKVHELNPAIYIGKARVIDVTGHERIGKAELETFSLDGVKRLLLRTENHNDPTVFPEKYAVLRDDIGPYLKEKGIFLIGLDSPSVDPVDSKELTAHHALHQNGVYILENIMLGNVKPGDYELIAVPLAIEGADGSPVRALLRKG